MDEENSEVVLLGSWASSYCTKVELALKLKGVPYKYVEEDLTNKSDFLLKYNPVHKKVPTLLHKGRPICESNIILEYIDEVWDHSPKLLPEDPKQRAKHRFWANYFDQKIIPSTFNIYQSKGEDRNKTIEDLVAILVVFEEGIKKNFDEQIQFFNSEPLGFLDIVVAATCCSYEAFHEACNIEVFTVENMPKFFMWVNALKEHPLVKETLPPHDKLVAKLKSIICLLSS